VLSEGDETMQQGKTLLIANPASRNYKGSEAAIFAFETLKNSFPEGFEFLLTEKQGHALEIASQSGTYHTVIALGGDGLIHETVNGLMRVPEKIRPALGVLPFGSGNDYARTIGMDFSIEKSVEQILNTEVDRLDLGKCNDEYFVETLSFGLDAAIAIDTYERRTKTGRTGARLFLESGIDMLLHELKPYDYTSRLDKQDPVEGTMYLFAIQIGKTYGGGFTICPDADEQDGLFDICIAHPPLPVPKAIIMLLLAKSGRHTRFKELEFKKAKKLSLKFDKQPPAQLDGERFSATSFEVSCVQKALRVLRPL